MNDLEALRHGWMPPPSQWPVRSRVARKMKIGGGQIQTRGEPVKARLANALFGSAGGIHTRAGSRSATHRAAPMELSPVVSLRARPRPTLGRRAALIHTLRLAGRLRRAGAPIVLRRITNSSRIRWLGAPPQPHRAAHTCPQPTEVMDSFLTAFDPSDLPGASIDPLGFERGYLFLADKILPGLTNVASRPRYFAALCVGASLCNHSADQSRRSPVALRKPGRQLQVIVARMGLFGGDKLSIFKCSVSLRVTGQNHDLKSGGWRGAVPDGGRSIGRSGGSGCTRQS
jgi:hypothetical protein